MRLRMRKSNLRCLLLLWVMALLVACSNSANNFAPVSNGWDNSQAASQTYRVQPDDTLYSIAFRYGLDYRQLAAANHIDTPYHITTGQTLVLLPEADDTLTTAEAPAGSGGPIQTGAAPTTSVSSQPVTTTPAPAATNSAANQQSVASPAPAPTPLPAGPIGKWNWPTTGKVIHTFSDVYGGNKGIDIAGSMGQTIRATATGRVVYCGTGLRGYGLLIIIKHNTDFLSAYAHNSEALIKEGDMVKAGQAIAEMGNSDASQVMLHFEIRKSGKPVDPLTYLPPQG